MSYTFQLVTHFTPSNLHLKYSLEVDSIYNITTYHESDHDGQAKCNFICGFNEDDSEADGHSDNTSKEGSSSNKSKGSRVDVQSQIPNRIQTDSMSQYHSSDWESCM